MSKRKLKIIALILLIIVSLILSSCSKVKNVTDAIQKGTNIEAGVYEFKIDVTTKTNDAIYNDGYIKITGITDGAQHLITAEYNDISGSYLLENFLLISEEKTYIKLDPVVDYIINSQGIDVGDISYKEKWLTIENAIVSENGQIVKQELLNTARNALSELAEKTTTASDKNEYTFSVTKENGLDEYIDTAASILEVYAGEFASSINAVYNNVDYTSISSLVNSITEKVNKEMNGEYELDIPTERNDEAMSTPYITQKLIDISTSLKSGDIKTSLNEISGRIAYSKSKPETFSIDAVIGVLEEDSCVTYKMSYTFTKNSAKITLPNSEVCMSTDETIQTVSNITSCWLSAIIDDDGKYYETQVSEYESSIVDNALVCYKSTPIYNETITYTFKKDAVDGVMIEIETSDITIHKALENYYNSKGYTSFTSEIDDIVSEGKTHLLLRANSIAISQFDDYGSPNALKTALY